jgi:DNA-binding transcriptional LysR family regulator
LHKTDQSQDLCILSNALINTSVTLSSFCKAGAFRGHAVENIPYVIPSSEIRDNPLSLKVRDGWNSNLSRLTPYRANSLSIALKMVQAGTCAIYTPHFLVAYLNSSLSKQNQFTELELPSVRRAQEKTTRDIFLVKRNSDDESKVMKSVVRILRQVCRG